MDFPTLIRKSVCVCVCACACVCVCACACACVSVFSRAFWLLILDGDVATVQRACKGIVRNLTA